MVKKIAGDDVIFAEESLIADVQFAIHNLLNIKDVKRVDLARALDMSEARISQLFGDRPTNLTLRTIAKIFLALGEEPQITSSSLREIIPLRGAVRGSPSRAWRTKPAAHGHRASPGSEWKKLDQGEANDNVCDADLAA